MFKNYIKIAWRNLIGYKTYSLINILGLAIGIASCAFIYVYILNEVSYDQHWKDGDRIVKINQYESRNEKTDPYGITPPILAKSLKDNVPGIEQITRTFLQNNQTVSYNNKYFVEDKQYFADENFLDVFNFELLKGDPKTCLKEPNSIVLSDAMASRYFGNTDPMGKTLKHSNKLYKVTGVLKNTKELSHFKPNALISFSSWSNRKVQAYASWFNLCMYTYVKLKPNVSIQSFNQSLVTWNKKVLEPIIRNEKMDYTVVLKGIPVKDIYFDKNVLWDQCEKGEKSYVLIFGWVACFILLIACFNYMNLSTARAVKRSKEVGLRKVIGASRSQLIIQFLSESFLISLVALILAMILLFCLIPTFNSVTGLNIDHVSILSNTKFWIGIISIILFISFIAGSYPAIYLSNFQPAKVLKGNLLSSVKSSLFGKLKLRQVLVVSQFALSIIIIISTVVIYKQIMAMSQRDLGFNLKNELVIKLPAYMDSAKFSSFKVFKEKLLKSPSIISLTTTRQIIGSAGRVDFFVKQKDKVFQTPLNINFCDHDYLKTFEIKLVKGRYYSKDFLADDENFVINESAAKLFNGKNPLDGELSFDGGKYGKIIGVVKDFNYKSPHSPIEPLVIYLKDVPEIVYLKLAPGKIPEGIKHAEKEWSDFFPGEPFSYSFFEDKYNEQYNKDHIMIKLFSVFSLLTIFISCMGLFGLTSYTIERRTKEIGIRKVIGASIYNINLIISKDFMMLVIIAMLIAFPISYYYMKLWLQDFAYRTEMNLWIFLVPGFLTFFIAVLTVSFQTIRASLANPVKSLRAE